MKPLIAIFGYKKSGKTKLIEYLVRRLTDGKYRVGVIKHVHHGDFEVDKEGKDTWRCTRSGARAVAAFSDKRLFVNVSVDEDPDFNEVVNMVGKYVDLILVEGFSSKLAMNPNVPKIIIGKEYPIEHIRGQILSRVVNEDDYEGVYEHVKRLIRSYSSNPL